MATFWRGARLPRRPSAASVRLTETRFRDKQIIPFAQLHHWRHYFTWRSSNSPSGFPDLVLVRAPRIVFAELKSATGIVEPAQTEWLEALRACPGVETYLWRPDDWREIERILD